MTNFSTKDKRMTGDQSRANNLLTKAALNRLRLLGSSSVAAAAMALAAVPTPAEAQRAPGMMVQNYPTGNAVTVPQRVEMAQNQPHAASPTLPSAHQPQMRAPDFNARDIRIAAPVERLPVNDVRISAPVSLPNAHQPQTRAPDFQARDIRISSPVERLPRQDIRISSPVSLPDAYQPQQTLPNFNVEDIRISAPVVGGLETIAINTGVTLPDANQPQAFTPIAAGVQALVSIASGSVSNPASTVDGVRTIDVLGVGLRDTIQLGSSELILNWAPVDTDIGGGNIDFLPAGNVLRFVRDAGDFTVLNRILPTDATRAVGFNGLVESFVGGTTNFGGNVWFFSPGGIVVGSTGRFDVGSLVLTTSDINTTGGLFGPGGEIRFRGAASPTGGPFPSVTIADDATINALNDDSYVALVAPRVVQGGDVTVNGSAAYVGAEQADLTFNNGLFDINVTVGTNDANGVVHASTGNTGGPSSQPSRDLVTGGVLDSDAQAIYMVAVPKNTAITMLVGGSVGYDAAAVAGFENGKIVLSAGANVSTGGNTRIPTIEIDRTAAPSSDANIVLQGGDFQSTVDAFATNNTGITTRAGEIITFNSGVALNLSANNQIDIDLSGTDSGIVAEGTVNMVAGSDTNAGAVNIDISNGATIQGDGTLNATTGSIAGGGAINLETSGGFILMPAGEINLRAGFQNNGGAISIAASGVGGIQAGNLTADVSAIGLDDFFTVRNNGGTGIGQDATAGTIDVNLGNSFNGIDGAGVIQILGDINLLATAQGGKGENANGFAQSGDINVNLGSAGSLQAINVTANTTTTSAQAGKIGGSGPGLLGSDGISGDVNFNLAGGATQIFGTLSINADAEGSTGTDAAQLQSNDATAGNINFNVTGGTHGFDTLNVSSIASSGFSFDANGNDIQGDVQRGSFNLAVSNDGTAFGVANLLNIDVGTSGANSSAGSNQAVSITATDTGTAPNTGINLAGGLSVRTVSEDGNPGDLLTSGSVSLVADNSDFGIIGLTINTEANTGFSALSTADAAQAGDIALIARNGGTLGVTTANLDASASGRGDISADAMGGDIFINANDGTINVVGSFEADTSAIGGNAGLNENGVVATGQGGDIRLLLDGVAGTSSMTFGDIDLSSDGSVESDGEGGGFFAGNGGTGIGGDVVFDILSGTLTATNITVSANGIGGVGGNQPTPTPPSGGTPPIASASLPFPVDLTLAVTPFANSTDPRAGDGGVGQGGDVTFNLNGGNATTTNMSVSANGFGGNGGYGDAFFGTNGGNGGEGIGGNAIFNGNSGSLTVTNTLTISADANNQALAPYGAYASGGYGFGAYGGAGGNGQGGTALFNLEGDATVTTTNLIVSTNASGGDGGGSFDGTTAAGVLQEAGAAGNGGNATGGNSTFNDTSGTLVITQATISSTATGGDGGNNYGYYSDGGNAGGDGGSATGGIAITNLNQGNAAGRNFTIDSTSTGGNGGRGFIAGDGGNGQGGTARLNVNNAAVTASNVSILSGATGGNGGGPSGTVTNSTGGSGGSAIGGLSILDVNGAAGAFTSTSITTITSGAVGGLGGAAWQPITIDSGPTAGTGGDGGDATGGTIQVSATGGATLNYTADSLTSARGIAGTGGAGGDSPAFTVPGNGGAGGDATGGSITFSATGGSTFNASGNGSDSQLLADAAGGAGGLGGTGLTGSVGNTGDGGGAAGGAVNLTVDGAGSSMTFAENLRIDVGGVASRDATGRFNFSGGDANGGAVSIAITNGGDFTVNGALAANSAALGGFGDLSSGSATGGTVDISMSGATSNFALLGTFDPSDPDFNLQNRSLAIQTGNQGGTSGTTASAGDDTSGNVSINFIDGTANLGSDVFITTQTNVYGTNGGGNAVAGNVELTFTGGVVTLGDLNVLAGSGAGDGQLGSASGSGTGGDITVINTGNLTIGAVNLTSRGQSGRASGGSTAGDAIGGDVNFSSDGVLNGLTSLDLRSDAFGNTGQTGAATVDGGEGGSAVSGDITAFPRRNRHD